MPTPLRSSIIVLLSLAVAAVAVPSGSAVGQAPSQVTAPSPEPKAVSPEIPILAVARIEVQRFERPIRPGTGDERPGYREALVLELDVPRQTMDDLPPSMEPFLYIGPHEVRIFQVIADPDHRRLRLVFHVPHWEELPDRAPMVLTIDHGAPVRHPGRFAERQDLFRFQKDRVRLPER